MILIETQTVGDALSTTRSVPVLHLTIVAANSRLHMVFISNQAFAGWIARSRFECQSDILVPCSNSPQTSDNAGSRHWRRMRISLNNEVRMDT